MNIEKIAQAIEADAGMPLADLRQGLSEMQAGLGLVTTPEQLLVRGSTPEPPKIPISIEILVTY